jgi:hypothetical protein
MAEEIKTLKRTHRRKSANRVVKPEVKSVEFAEIKQEAKPIVVKLKIKQNPFKSLKKIWPYIVGTICIPGGIYGCVLFTQSMNTFIGMVSVVALMGGCGVIYWGAKRQELSTDISTAIKVGNIQYGKQDKNLIANCLNIFQNEIKFENFPHDKLLGYPRLCRNDKKYYFVHISGKAFGGKDDSLKPFKLPDTQYRPPEFFALNLNLPAHKDLVKHTASLLEKLSPLLILGAMGVIGLVWVMTSPAPIDSATTNKTAVPPKPKPATMLIPTEENQWLMMKID